MSWRDSAVPVPMLRVALVAPREALRDVLVRVASAAAVEIDHDADGAGEGAAARALRDTAAAGAAPLLSASRPDLTPQASDDRASLIAGEAQLQAYAGAATRRGDAAALAGWIPAGRLASLSEALAPAGGAVVVLPRPAGLDPPTLLAGPALHRALTPLVQTYGIVPYADLDPTWLAWAAYVVMFGMMFGDLGQGLLMAGVAIALRAGWPRRAQRLRAAWPFVGGAGICAAVFGLLYGECFGPTGIIAPLWISPLSQPVPLLLAAAAGGALLLAGSYALGVANRWREGGWRWALYAPSGIAGSCIFLGASAIAGGWYTGSAVLLAAGGLTGLAGLALSFAGFLASAGGGGAGLAQALVELTDTVVRLGSNVVSFTRLAAFGLAHAALGGIVWAATQGLWHRGGLAVVAAVAVFAVGMAVAFSLEALVAAVQALRLEYYELFSRVFVTQGHQFRPWHIPTARPYPAPASGEQPAAGARTEGADA